MQAKDGYLGETHDERALSILREYLNDESGSGIADLDRENEKARANPLYHLLCAIQYMDEVYDEGFEDDAERYGLLKTMIGMLWEEQPKHKAMMLSRRKS